MPDQISFSSLPLDAVRTPSFPGSANQEPDQMKKACSELESFFIYYLLKEMRATVPKSGLMGGGKTEETYTSMLDLQMAKEIASKRELGISSAILGQLESKTGPHPESKNEAQEEKETDGP